MDARITALRGLACFAGWSLVVLLLLVVPAASAGGNWASVAAWCLTFLPGAAIVALADRFREPKLAVAFVLGSTAFRMAVAGVGAAIVLLTVPATPKAAFLVWLGGMYLLALGVEIYLAMSMNSLGSAAKFGLRPVAPISDIQEAGH